jgi:hypothetical protein
VPDSPDWPPAAGAAAAAATAAAATAAAKARAAQHKLMRTGGVLQQHTCCKQL